MNERKAVKYHARLVAALRRLLAKERGCACALCEDTRALLAELDREP